MSSFDLGSAHVTTFYSFKGGVGRSLLLANVGWMLAARRRVLLWDLDVEAPGLHRIPALEPAEVPQGFFEWLTDKSEQEPIELAGLGEMPEEWAESLRGLVQPVPGRPHLSILPAFGEGADFARLYAEGPWRRLLVEQPAVGLAVFRSILQVLAEERDHILIDSRTGITDIGGFLAALLPHATVLVGSYGHQSVEGLLHVHKALEEAVAGRLEPRVALGAGSKLKRIHVVSPVPPDEVGAAERRQIWGEVFSTARPIEVPLDRRLLWGERLLGAEDPSSQVAKAYRRVEERLQQSRLELLADREAVDEEAAKFPDQDRLHGSSDPSLRTRQGKSFEDRVARLLELHGYRVEREQILGGNKVDLVARITGGLDEQCWWVECKDHQKPVGKDVFEKLAVWITGDEGKAQDARGMVVARSFSPAALTLVSDRRDLRAWTLEDLERRLFDPRRYLTSLVSSFENSVLGRTYVDQRVLLEDQDEEDPYRQLLPYAQDWIDGKGPRLWLLLGDYGTGKSAFFQRFVYELARRALDDPEQPFPLAIDLKRFPNATSVDTLLYEHLKATDPKFRGDPAGLLHLLSVGRCVLLLDAFDEMGVAAAGRSVEDQFRELARLAGEEPLEPRLGNRMLITCRTHFFRDQQQVKDTASARPQGLVASEDSALGRLARRFNARIDELSLFDEDEVQEFLAKHLGDAQVERAWEFIQETYDLKRLASRAVLLEMIVKSLPKLWQEGRGAVTSAGLYEVYTRLWLEDRSGRNLQTPPELRHRLLTLLASVLWRRDDRQLHHWDLIEEVRGMSRHFPGLNFERVDIELRTAAFLVRSADGYYRFSHKSFLEYFLACGLWSELQELESGLRALDLPPLSPEVGEFFWRLRAEKKHAEERERRLEVLQEILTDGYRARASENALRLGYWSSGEEAFSAAGAQLARARLVGVDLTGIILSGADLCKANLEKADLDGASLEKANLDDARLAQANLRQASLSGASLRGADLRGANLVLASLRDSLMVEVCIDGADLTYADLSMADLTNASGKAAILTNAKLEGTNLSDSSWREWKLYGTGLDPSFSE